MELVAVVILLVAEVSVLVVALSQMWSEVVVVTWMPVGEVAAEFCGGP
jgi:hypothetical protein